MKSLICQTLTVFRKETVAAARFKGAWLTMLMFSLTALSLTSLVFKGTVADSATLSAVYWTVIFFSAMTSVDRLFMEEEFSGTIQMLKVYGGAIPILFGKMLYGFLLLLILSVIITFLFVVLFDGNIPLENAVCFFANLILGVFGLSAAGAFLAALSASARVKNGLFTVLMLPVMLPVLLPVTEVTTKIFEGVAFGASALIPALLYDLVLMLASSLLFDYIWYDDL